MGEKKKKMHVKIPTSVVRNENFYISNEDFVLYARICWLYFRNANNPKNEIIADHIKLMNFCRIKDNRTFKARMGRLANNELILNFNKKAALPSRGFITITFNEKVYDEPHFTMLNVSIFNYFRNEQINADAFRQVFYYKSHINNKYDNALNHNYCFVGFKTLAERLRVGRDSINKANQQLKSNKLVKITKHELKPTDEYNDSDELIYTKYNNHYEVEKVLC